MWSCRSSHPRLLGVQRGVATVEGVAVSYRLNIGLLHSPAMMLLGVLPTGLEYLGPHKNLQKYL